MSLPSRFHLKSLGLDAAQLGLALRPLFPEASGWTVVLREVCSTKKFSHLERIVWRATGGVVFGPALGPFLAAEKAYHPDC